MPVSEANWQRLREKMAALNVREEDLLEHFVRSSGAGGQKVNKTSSCVVLKHVPSGLEVKCQVDRSQSVNRFLARRILVDKLERITLGKKSAEEKRIWKIKKQKKKRSKRAKEKVLAEKRHQSEKKARRTRCHTDF